MSLPVNWVT